MRADEKIPSPPEKKFGCPACGGKMTYGLTRCDSCGEESPIYNRKAFWPVFYASVAALVLALAAWLVIG